MATQEAAAAMPLSLGGNHSALNDTLANDMAQLGHADIDIKRWVNTTLSHLLESKGGPSTSAAAAAAPLPGMAEVPPGEPLSEEELVNALYRRVERHAQEVGNSVEELVGQTVVRLPRTTMEMSRMMAETEVLSKQLEGIVDDVRPALEGGGAAPHVSMLNGFNLSQKKLERCLDILDKAAAVDANVAKLSSVVEQLRSGRTDTEEGSVNKIADAVRRVQSDLQELRLVDENYGERYKTTLADHEQFIEGALEKECLSSLARHDVERAAALFGTLNTIGRADATLVEYAAAVAANDIARMDELLVRGTVPSASAAASIISQQLLPTVGRTLGAELDFLMKLAVRIDSTALTKEVVFTAPDATASATSVAKVGTTEKILQVMNSIVQRLGAAFQAAVAPVLHKATNNAEIIHCYDAVQHVKLVVMPSNAVAAASPATASTVEGGSSKAVPSATAPAVSSGFTAQERITRQVAAMALSVFALSFTDKTVIQAFSDRVNCQLAECVSLPGMLRSTHMEDVLAHVLLDSVKELMHFFPEKTLPLCVGTWQTSLTALLTPLQPRNTTSQTQLLDHLWMAAKVLKPGLTLCQKRVEGYLTSAEVAQMFPSSTSQFMATLAKQLWQPIFATLDACITENQRAVKDIILKPVVGKTASYAQLPCWKRSSAGITGSASPLAVYSEDHMAPTQPVRDLGEAIMEIPLALESLRGEEGLTSAGGQHGECMKEMLDESAEAWLDDIVRSAVENFVENKVRQVVIDFSLLPTQQQSTAGEADALKKISAAWEQLKIDMEYLKNVLSAVSDSTFDSLEEVLAGVRGLAPPTSTAQFKVADVLASAAK